MDDNLELPTAAPKPEASLDREEEEESSKVRKAPWRLESFVKVPGALTSRFCASTFNLGVVRCTSHMIERQVLNKAL